MALREVLGGAMRNRPVLWFRRNVCASISHIPAMLTQDELRNVEQIVNEAILANYPWRPLRPRMMTRSGTVPLRCLARKYSRDVRVLRVGVGDAVIESGVVWWHARILDE